MLKAVSRTFRFIVLIVRLINHRVWLAVAVIRSMWVFHDRPLDISTPKYTTLVTNSGLDHVHCVNYVLGCCHPYHLVLRGVVPPLLSHT